MWSFVASLSFSGLSVDLFCAMGDPGAFMGVLLAVYWGKLVDLSASDGNIWCSVYACFFC